MLFTKEEMFEYQVIDDSAIVINESYLALKKRGINNLYFGNTSYQLDDFFGKIKEKLIYIESIYQLHNLKNSIVEMQDIVKSFTVDIRNDYITFSKGVYSNEDFIHLIVTNVADFFYKLLKSDLLNNGLTTSEFDYEFKLFTEELISIKNFQPIVEVDNNQFYDKLLILESKVDNYILNNKIDFDSRVDNVLNNFSKRINDIQQGYETDLLLKVQSLTESYENNKENLENLLGNVSLYESMVHVKTENEISKHYSAKAKEEKITYWGATSVSILIIIVSIGLAWHGLDSYYQNYVSVSQCTILGDYKNCIEKLDLIRSASKDYAFYYLIMRLIFSILLFLTVIYTSRIAIRAYSHWRHSENMHLKLASLRPFISRLEPDEQSQIHKDLVPDYFGKDAGIIDGQNEKFKDLPANVSAVAMKAIEQIGSGGGSSEGKNDKKEEA